ncbi:MULTISPECIES: RNA ligase family protein [Nitrosomonas]|uniref:Possible homolog of eukaryotic DNA ligase III n=1 Tax=Nitrosomonas europaea (strain ATCC 19718 / CIP 103999 / KCTC 2705 / NBRC 14298) TaxID=228410 RepID=Q82TK3_NITEU|nr:MULTISPECIES: RNA ligase family protein [Nitrosomonas]MEB2331022.1 RNA ligase family protein [Nitrosomonas sp.]CAD85795.1 possible homolog of eukaryotic DNA ligase III [Nitrosomonas europaea ATCC 19718]HBF24783.1 DNA ligase [Nitrosomonas sp.]HRN81453.1 RNA ligase family protein [Nitrosomonas europaea]HRO56401.1 RNA ligase family protein [Nitrosomonas europaea]
MTDFFRFPNTPHLLWLGQGQPRDDKILSDAEIAALLQDEVLIEEKLDGANLGISLDEHGELRAQNRGQYLPQPFSGQFSRLNSWLGQHGEILKHTLTPEMILFGEWCAARHSLDYNKLPDWFLLFDVYDREAGKFWSVERRNQLAQKLNITTVPLLKRTKITCNQLVQLLDDAQSRYRSGKVEGIVIRCDSPLWCESRAKLVNREFVQAIEDHWRSRSIEWNLVHAGSVKRS